ncbi:HipA domain-containing protein [Candidatus Aquiluna sp. UB-MaderosW2red]|uniref:HipA domain-containing protein n=1 Tax=Candidatus Aquiluna sp. UB-MaderosW2red TaxID=1855377 RepID=UPI000875BA2D|nr:HipA domain-containing protein [Candidatus Aquiluna sp. UB-MaderosW2red]SCX05680.1 serine/threonine-protein kinase HipA [Candidatus Aquiluna sp. UB-MaderosW2red]
MNAELNIKLNGISCGVVSQTRSGNITIQYDPGYQEDQTPISLSMPIGQIEYPKKVALPFLQGLLPDNENALRSIAKRYGANQRNPFSLLKHVGQEVAGALEFTSGTVEQPMESTRLLSESDIETILKEKINEYEDGTVGTSTKINLSLAGAQAKLALRLNTDGSWQTPSGEDISTHIIKPVPDRWQNLDIVEHQTMLAASYLGLNVAQTQISQFGATQVFISKRYDRKKTPEGVLERVHQEDLCQALSVPPSKKYQRDDGGPGVGEISRLFQGIYRSTEQKKVAAEFFRALVFNVAARCTDAHAKNYSLILDQRSVSLAPLYDLSSTVLYGLPQKSAMSINSKYKFSEITFSDLIFEAKRLKLDSDWAESVIKETNENLLQAFSDAGNQIRAESDSAHPTTNALLNALSDSRR